jgi:hypothetical protein
MGKMREITRAAAGAHAKTIPINNHTVMAGNSESASVAESHAPIARAHAQTE